MKGEFFMKTISKFGALMAMAAITVVSLLGAQSAHAIVNGSKATAQYGVASIWTPPGKDQPNRHRCHVSVIDPRWGVTAAHCLEVTIPGTSEIRASGFDLRTPYGPSNPKGYKETTGVQAVFPHRNYVPDQGDAAAQNDIALIRFTSPIVQTAPLALPSSPPAVGDIAKVAGWGWVCDAIITAPNCGLPTRFAEILQELSLKTVSDSECTYPHVASQYFCVKAAANINAMACVGDSGAPVVRKLLNKYYVMGVVMGDGDEVTGHPNFCSSNEDGGQGTGLIVQVAPHKQWIQDTMYNYPANANTQTSVPTNPNSRIKL